MPRETPLLTRPCCAFALFTVMASVIRVPHFYRDVIDWDESTFILMGQNLLDGTLPYVTLWDNKPPLCFVPFALVIALFGKSIPAVRGLGLVAVIACAQMTYGIASRFGGRRCGVIAGLSCVALLSYMPSGLATMSELLALVPLLGALVLALRPEVQVAQWCGVGACLAVASLTRTNLAVVVVTVGILVVYDFARRDTRLVGAFMTGVAMIWLACMAPYAATGTLDTFFTSVFVAPFRYAAYGVLRKLPWLHIPLVLTVIDGRFLESSPALRSRRPLVAYSVTFALSVVLSIFLSGGGSAAHYWLQALPFLAIIVGIVVDRVLQRTRCIAIATIGLAALAPIVWNTTHDTRAMLQAMPDGKISVYGTSVKVAEHIAARNPEQQPVLLFSDHLAYWFLGMQPMSKILVHPTNIFRKSTLAAVLGPGATSLGEITSVFAKRPLYVVRQQSIRVAPSAPDALRFLDTTLARDYTLETRIDDSFVYRRTQLP